MIYAPNCSFSPLGLRPVHLVSLSPCPIVSPTTLPDFASTHTHSHFFFFLHYFFHMSYSSPTFDFTFSVLSHVIASSFPKGPSTLFQQYCLPIYLFFPPPLPQSLKCLLCSLHQGVSQGPPPRCLLSPGLPPGPLSLISPKTPPTGPTSVMGTLTPWRCSEGRCLSSR